jgi:hypothetical protein
MKLIKITLLLLLVGPATVGVAWADHHQSYGHFYGPRLGLYLDPWPLFFPPIGYYPYYPYPRYSEIVTLAAPVVYVEQSPSPVNAAPANSQPTAPSNDWYYCHKPDGYYPYVRNCQSGWQRVPSQPVFQH